MKSKCPRALLRTGWRLCLILGLFLSLAHAATAQDESPRVYLLRYEGAITPVLENYLKRAIDEAIATNAEAIVLQLDTPGGELNAMKSITQLMLASPVPIAIYVSPSGAHAASAGTFVTLAGHVAAMAPNTTIGAASPVDSSGGDIGETMEAKVKNTLSADIENLARRRGPEATEWAISTVQDAAAATAERALELGAIDYIALDIRDLLEKMHGTTVTVAGREHTFNTEQALQIPVELNWQQRILNLLFDPQIAAFLFTIGTLGLIIEVRTPGFGAPGIVGAIALLLFFYVQGQLDGNLTGLLLIGLAFILFVAEAFTPTFGVLAVGGAAAFIVGSILLFDTPGARVPWVTIIGTGGGLAAFSIFAGYKALRAQSNPVMTGAEGLIGQIGTAKFDLVAGKPGSVFVAGEWWNAELTSGTVLKDEQVRVVSRQGYTLLVEPVTLSISTPAPGPAQA